METVGFSGFGGERSGWVVRTFSPKVSQKDRSRRVTTRPGDEGVPRWSSLVVRVLVVSGDGMGGWKGEWEDGPGLPEPTDVAFYVSWYSTIWESEG